MNIIRQVSVQARLILIPPPGSCHRLRVRAPIFDLPGAKGQALYPDGTGSIKRCKEEPFAAKEHTLESLNHLNVVVDSMGEPATQPVLIRSV